MTNSLSPTPAIVAPARVTFRAPGVTPITLSAADMADLSVTDTVELFGVTYTRDAVPAPVLMVSTYTPPSGIKSARIVGASVTVLITRDRWNINVWECWYSDSTRVMHRGSFRSCVAVARSIAG